MCGPTWLTVFFFFKQKTAYEMRISDWSSDVCSSDLTATGHVFAAWLPPKIAQHYIEREIGDKAVVTSVSPLLPDPKALQAMLDEVRRAGMARALGNPLPGIDALSVPVFDHSGNITLALNSLGPNALFDASKQGPIALALRHCAADIPQHRT